MSQAETIYKFDTDDDFQVIIESFIPKFINYLSATPTADLKSFLNSYENIFRQHLNSIIKDDESQKFTEEIIDKLLVYCLHRFIPEYVKNPLLEKALNKDNFTFDKIRNKFTITSLLGEQKKQTINKELSAISGKTKITGSTLPSESNQPTNESKTVIDQKTLQDYCGVLSLAITKVAHQLLKSKQKIDKVKSLKGIVTNNLNNIANSKYTLNGWSSIITGDKDIANRVMNVMTKIGVIEISDDHRDLKLIDHKLVEFREEAFNDEELKRKVMHLIE